MGLETLGILIIWVVVAFILSALTGWHILLSGLVVFAGIIGAGLAISNN